MGPQKKKPTGIKSLQLDPDQVEWLQALPKSWGGKLMRAALFHYLKHRPDEQKEIYKAYLEHRVDHLGLYKNQCLWEVKLRRKT